MWGRSRRGGDRRLLSRLAAAVPTVKHKPRPRGRGLYLLHRSRSHSPECPYFPGFLWDRLRSLMLARLRPHLCGCMASQAAHADGLLKRTPSPPPFLSMNSTPASSSARRIARSFAAVNEVAASVSSARRIVVRPTDDERARSSALQRRSARPARIWALVSARRTAVDFFILYGTFHSIRIE
jgi:hypothetical protein